MIVLTCMIGNIGAVQMKTVQKETNEQEQDPGDVQMSLHVKHAVK
jgi:hypothetical protein